VTIKNKGLKTSFFECFLSKKGQYFILFDGKTGLKWLFFDHFSVKKGLILVHFWRF